VTSRNVEELAGQRVLVTGGAGFIGSHVVERLVEASAVVRVLDDFETGHRENLAHLAGRVEIIEGDVRRPEDCARALEGVTFVSHQAAYCSVPGSIVEPTRCIATNVMGFTNLLHAARVAGVRRIVYASSSSVYGDGGDTPKAEASMGSPRSPYALSKAVGEQLAALFVRSYGMQILGLRYFNVYGPRQNAGSSYAAVIPRFFQACSGQEAPVVHGDGEQTRDFVYVGDVADVNVAALTSRTELPDVLNVGTGRGTTINQLARHVARLCDYHGDIRKQPSRDGDVRFSLADTTLLAETLGFAPAISLEAGLALAFEFYRVHGDE
jgi:nucleoside-diphosphate-sugar epimerase